MGKGTGVEESLGADEGDPRKQSRLEEAQASEGTDACRPSVRSSGPVRTIDLDPIG